MNSEKFNQYLKDLNSKSSDILASKSHDYADADMLSNFKRNSEIAKNFKIDYSEFYHHALMMTLMKWDRVQNLVGQGKTPKNESIEDTLIDLVNYTILTTACIKEMLDERSKAQPADKKIS